MSNQPRTAWSLTILALIFAAVLLLGKLRAMGDGPILDWLSGECRDGQCDLGGCPPPAGWPPPASRSRNLSFGGWTPAGNAPVNRIANSKDDARSILVRIRGEIGTSGHAAHSVGIIVDYNVVLTCGHALPSTTNHQIQLCDGRKVKAYLTASDASLDLALFYFTHPDGKHNWIRLRSTALPPGQPFVWQSLDQTGLSLVAGRGTSVGYRGSFFIGRSNRLPQEGNSGGLIMDVNGHLVSIISTTYPGEREVSGPSVTAILAFLKLANETPPIMPGPNTPGPSSPQGPPGEEAGKQPDAPLAPPMDDTGTPEVPAGPAVDQEPLVVATPEKPVTLPLHETENPVPSPQGASDAPVVSETTPRPPASNLSGAAGALLTIAMPVLTGIGWTTPPSAAALVGIRMALAVWRRRKEREEETRPPPLPAAPIESQTVTEEPPTPEAAYNINYRPQPVDPGLLRMRRAMQLTSDEYPASMTWIKRIETIYALILSGELK